MGVPKFYRWISERYPCLSEVVKEYQIPEFDNLYLDMNGIIHTCSHPEDDNPHFRITEEKIFQDIFHYIEVLFRMIKPRKVFFMAVDGVAPRAKMNQQRGRRFRSAREAENLVKKALEKGEVLPTEARFDSNCITPGTEFMAKLNEQLQYFVVKKISTDRLWQGVRVYLSGHETPGEGEHKVMDFIRHEKAQADFDPNTRHCLYGLDADLMMLGLTTHEPHFSLLREEVRFGKQATKRSNTAEETTFHLLHISLMREYIDFEFSSVKGKLPFGYDLERIIDDWVLMGFLVGNDFIPHLPDLHIHHDALPMVWKTYKKVLPTLNGYMNDGGHLNLENFECFMRCLSKYDVDTFSEKHADIQWLQSRKKDKNKPDALGSSETGIPTANEFMLLRDGDSGDDNYSTSLQSDMESLSQVYDLSDQEIDDDYEDEKVEQNAQFYKEFSKFKAGYYKDKLQYTNVNSEVLHEQAFEYVKAIQWILHYYFNGVPSWSWFYPFHYAPYLSDVRGFSKTKLEYDFARPFLPFQQLMAVLPSASKNLIPQPLQSLMLDDSSPVKDFYPVDFETDLNGKQQEWEAVVLIPFIQEDRLLTAMKPLEEKLTDEEKGRNKHGPHVLCVFSPEPQGIYTSSVFPDLINHHAVITEVRMEQFWVDTKLLKKGLCAGVKQDVYFPGFPTLKHIPHSARLKKAGVKIFQHVSRGENMIITVHNTKDCDHEQLAHSIIGRSIHVHWPHLIEAKVNAISDGETRFYGVEMTSQKSKSHKESKLTIQSEDLDQDATNIWHKEVASIKDTYMFRKGVDITDTLLLVYASPLTGRKYICGSHGKVTLEKQWSSSSLPFVLQCAVKDLTVKDPSFKEYNTLGDLFCPGSQVFMLGQPYYGSMGEVLSVDPKNDGRIRVDFTILEQPETYRILQQRQNTSDYYPGYSLARRIGVSNYVLSRITGSVFVTRGSKGDSGSESRGNNRVNVGLNLKFNKTGMEVPGYTRKTNDEWTYGSQLQDLIEDYYAHFPELFDFISSCSNESTYFENDIFEGTHNTLSDVTKYLKEAPTAGVQPVPHGSEVLDERTIADIEAEVDRIKELNRKKKKHIKMQVRPHLLFRPLEAQLNLVPDPSTTYALFDRVVNVRDGFSVPLGMTGTVTGITNAEKDQDVLYDVVFDDEFMGGLTLRCTPLRGYRMPKTAMINMSHGERKASGKVLPQSKPTAVVKPQSTPGRTYATTVSQYDQLRAGQSSRNPQQQNQHGQRYHDNSYHGNRSNLQNQGNHQHDGYHGNRPNLQNQGNQQHDGYYANRPNLQNQGNHQNDGYHGNRHAAWNQQVGPPQFFQNRANGTGAKDVQQQNYQRDIPQPGPQNDFADMWHQLQGAYDVGNQSPRGQGQSPRGQGQSPRGKGHTQQIPPNNNKNKQKQREDSLQTTSPGQPSKQRGSSLQDAAIALQGFNFSQGPSMDHHQSVSKTNQNVANQDLQKQSSGSKDVAKTDSQKIDLDSLFNAQPMFSEQTKKRTVSKGKSKPSEHNQLGLEHADPFSSANEFNSIFDALKIADVEKTSEVPKARADTVGESTAALCQMLNITSSQAKEVASVDQRTSESRPTEQPTADKQLSGAPPSYGKQLSVQDLFGEAKEHQNQTQSTKSQKSPVKGGNKNMSAVENLDAWCKAANLPSPHYDYHIATNNKHQAVVRLANGQVYQGSYTKSASQAADSAASVALLQQTMGPRMRGAPMVFGPNIPSPHHQQQQQQQQQQGKHRLSTSPNSAFTPVRQNLALPMGGRPPFPNWGQCPPFPPPPHFGPPPHQQPRFTSRQPNPQWGQGHRPSHGQYPVPPGLFGPQGHDFPPPPFPSSPRDKAPRPSHSGGHHQGSKTHKDVGKKSNREDSGNKSEGEAAKKSNQFIPMQVLRQQKTPQKDSKRSAGHRDSENSNNVLSDISQVCPPEHITTSTADITQQVVGPECASNTALSNPSLSSPSDKRNSSDKERDQTKTKTTPKSQGRRPKSRLAANFGAGNK